MVRLLMTEALVSAIKICDTHGETAAWPLVQLDLEPNLQEPAVGKPITHAQILDIQKQLVKLQKQARYHGPCDLDDLLRGTRIWMEPPKLKAGKTAEYEALMARLRAEQEAQSYSRMLIGNSNAPSYSSNTSTPLQTFAQRFPHSPYVHLFPDSGATLPSRLASAGQIPSRFSSAPNPPAEDTSVLYDDASLATVNRQLTLIGNIFVSIVATAIAIWWATWHWSTTARLGISMGGSSLVGVAEIVVYWGYIQRLENAKGKEQKKKERKRVTKTWIIESRKGIVEKRLAADGNPKRNAAQNEATASGSWPEPSANSRKRVTKGKV